MHVRGGSICQQEALYHEDEDQYGSMHGRDLWDGGICMCMSNSQCHENADMGV